MDIKELFEKYSFLPHWVEEFFNGGAYSKEFIPSPETKIMTIEGFTEAVAEIISSPVEPGVMQKPTEERINKIREILLKHLDIQEVPDIMNEIRNLIREARREGILFTKNLAYKHGIAKTFNDRIEKELRDSWFSA